MEFPIIVIDCPNTAKTITLYQAKIKNRKVI